MMIAIKTTAMTVIVTKMTQMTQVTQMIVEITAPMPLVTATTAALRLPTTIPTPTATAATALKIAAMRRPMMLMKRTLMILVALADERLYYNLKNQMAERITQAQAQAVVNDKKTLHNALSRNQWFVPRLQTQMMTIEFMLGVQCNDYWLPRTHEIRLLNCGDPPAKHTIAMLLADKMNKHPA